MRARDQGTGDGRVIDGKYRLGPVLRRNDWSITYRAEHIGIQRSVFLKMLPASLPAEGVDAERLLREARAAGSVAHRNVQSVVDSGTDQEGRPFVVYEALEGPTVAQLLEENPAGLDEPRAVRIAVQILEGLHAVHRGGVVHRALGPDRIVVTAVRGGGDLVKIAGFDEAVFQSEAVLVEPPTELPPRSYVAPEASRRAAASPSLDVYAAGVLLRALLTGTPEPGGTLSDTARRAVERATASRPEERFPDADLLLHAAALLQRTSQRPPRDEMPTPTDPLVADLQYLRLLGRTRSDVGALRPEARLQLLPVLLVIEAIYKKLGRAQWEELVQRIPEVEELLPGSGNTDLNMERGVPVALVSRVLSTVDELAGKGDLGVVADLGEMVARRGLGRILPSLPAGYGPDALVDGFGELWATITDQGDVAVLDRTRSSARLTIRGQREPTLELCAVMAGLLRGALRETGHGGVEVYTTACEALGDAACVYGLRWSR